MNTLIFRGSKFTFLLLMLFAMPICIEIEFILNVWLKEVPDYTVIFVQLMVAMMVIDSTANPLMTAAAATGKVKKYQTVLSLVYLSNLPLSYIALKMGAEPWSVFVINTAICCVNFFVRLLLIRPMINFSIRQYINRVCSPCILVATVSSIIPVSLHLYLPTTTVQSLVTIAIAIASVGVCSLYLGLDRHERNVIFSKIRLITDKLK